MIRVEQADGFIINLPNKWDDLSPEQFIAMVNVDKKDTYAVLSIILGFDFKEIENVHAPNFAHILFDCMNYFLTTPPTR